MPHVIVKLWPGKTKAQKQRLCERISEAVMDELNYGEESVSVGFEEIAAEDWKSSVYKPDILAKSASLLKKPGYSM